ncbi:RNA-binding protein 42 [Porphyridium purpureum]|uniref:RNA-binding protein 42 n=1 Tax=Porphyridium purpureum TaxID=35688 RepID=A0A5J4YY18_PORPP|nr:RNA-binding protein 42 [Porphyridium purpureum]|eukprot:POR3665..scf209_3
MDEELQKFQQELLSLGVLDGAEEHADTLAGAQGHDSQKRQHASSAAAREPVLSHKRTRQNDAKEDKRPAEPRTSRLDTDKAAPTVAGGVLQGPRVPETEKGGRIHKEPRASTSVLDGTKYLREYDVKNASAVRENRSVTEEQGRGIVHVRGVADGRVSKDHRISPNRATTHGPNGTDVDTPGEFRIFVGNLSKDVTEDALRAVFSDLASFRTAQIVFDKRTHRCKGYGFVSFGDARDMLQAIKTRNGALIGGRPCMVKKSVAKP